MAPFIRFLPVVIAVAIWSVADRTFVLVAREARTDVERLAAVMQTTLE